MTPNIYEQIWELEAVASLCFCEGPSATHVQVSYEYIALVEKGRVFIESFGKEAYEAFIGEWVELIHSYIESTG